MSDGVSPRRSPAMPASALAILCLLVATATLFAAVWRAGIFEFIPVAAHNPSGDEHAPDWRSIVTADATLAAWLVPRNAYTLTHSPSRFFDAEFCAPDRSALAFGEPMLTLGIIAIPALFLTGDPIATYNLAVFTTFFLSAVAMYVLVADWTGSHLAAVAAALLYAFGSERVAGVTHSFTFDTSWIVFSLYFLRRWLAEGRWRDVIGMTVCGALQLGTSLYPIIASLLVSAPIAIGLVATYGVRRVRLGQVIFVVVAIASVTYLIFAPYLTVRATTTALRRAAQSFAEWSWFLPGREAGVTWTAALLAVAALVASFRRSTDAWPRFMPWCIALGALLAAAAAAGPSQPRGILLPIPNFYAALSALLPGLDAIRVPARVGSGYHLGVCLLAGVGAASLLRSLPRHALALGAALVAAAAVETLALAPGAGASQERFSVVRVAPLPEDLEFFAALARAGSVGPLLELPIGDRNREFVFQSPKRILLSAYHRRRTSACYVSFPPPSRKALRQDALLLPDPGALARICALGFTTAVVHVDTPRGAFTAKTLRDASSQARSGIGYLASNASMTAFRLCDVPADAHAGEAEADEREL